MSYYCYQHNWSSRYEQCPSCVTYKTTAASNTIEVTMPFQPKSVHELEAKLAASRIEIDKLEARCKELQEQNSILKAKLEKCKDGQVNMYHSEWSGGNADTEKFRAELELALDSITIDSIKRGEK